MTEPVYALNVGRGGVDRLALLQEVYGPTSRRRLVDAGLAPGARVLELACGSGTMTRFLAEAVGPSGRVVGVDVSPEQVDTARETCAGLGNVEFRVADASATGLAPAGFDLVYLRFLLMHLPDPAAVLAHVRTLLRPGGTLVCEEAAVDSTFSDPVVPEQRELQELAARLAAERGCDFNVARRLGSLVRSVGFELVDVAAHVPIYRRGPEKFLEAASFREALGHWRSATPETIARGHAVCDALERAAGDEAVVYGLSTMTVVRARSPLGS